MDLTLPTPYPARTRDYSAGDVVASNDLNAIQDGIVACSEAVDGLVDELREQALDEQTATTNQADSPTPALGGCKTIWVERSTNGTTAVTLDTSIDWRDRQILISGNILDASVLPGGINDDDGDGALAHWRFYSRDGRTSAPGTTECADIPGGSDFGGFASDHLIIYADQATGFLRMAKNATVDADATLVARISCSPQQGHY